MGKALSRRDFLKLSGAGLAGGALLGAAGCGGGGAESNELTVTFGPDPAGALQKVIDQFNQANEGGIQAKYRQMPADSSQYRDQITTELQAGGGDTDVIIADSVWVAQFAANGWISDLSNRFAEASRSNYLEATIEASTFEDRVYGVPQYASLAMLYYRKDLLKQSGFDEPPETWDELKEQAEQVMRDSDTEFGFVFQGGNYEGGVVNGLEYIWNAGGDVLDGDTVVIDSPESVEGLEIERSMVEDGIASEAVSNYKEQDAQIAFLNGDAVFCRNYSYMYTLSSDPSESEVEPEQIGVSSIPVASEGDRSYSGFGLWTSLINASSQLQDAAWEFVRHLSAPEQQKTFALESSNLPSRSDLYDDEDILDSVPVVALSKDILENGRPRPVSPYYSDMSLEMAAQFHDSLQGSVSPEEAISNLQNHLSSIVGQGED